MPRCLLISNRLPVAYHAQSNEFKPSSGGLASAIKGLDPKKVGFHFEWMGILTDDIPQRDLDNLQKNPVGNIPCHPIMVKKKDYDRYYNLYCNNVLWPLFHYERNMVHHSSKGWEAYQKVNEIVAEAILAEAKEDDVVWVHDFQLLLVPGFIKKKRPSLKVGFFLHIPFPSSEIFRELPEREEILESLARCDQIGFHDLSYLNHFRSSIQRVLGDLPQNEPMWGVYPISIDTQHFVNLTSAPTTHEFIQRYSGYKQKMKWILGVDRLDYIKGLPLKLRAYKTFLKHHPEERGHVQFLQVVIPSRTDVPEYKNLKDEIEKLVSSINGEFGSPDYMPVQYMYHSVSEHELSALYQLSDVLFIGSRRDGMNLVSLEYVMSQNDEYPGVILLSEFAGAHSTLSYAMSINPWDIHDTASKIKESLHHPVVKSKGEMGAMKHFLRNYTSSDWARIILKDLSKGPRQKETIPLLQKDGRFDWMKDLKDKKVLFFCDLDGTLAPILSNPKDVRLTEETLDLLQSLSDQKKCEFVVVSGRDKEFLEEQFLDNEIQFPLAACHGAYAFSPKESQWSNLIPNDNSKWKEMVMDILKIYTLRTPESFIEDKGHAITWHYRNSPKEFADFLANKLFIELEETLNNLPVQVKRGKKVIEVKSIHANKGYFVQQWISGARAKPDVVIALGDDTTDEDMFQILQERKDIIPYCIKVGKEKSAANYYIQEQDHVNLFLKNFITSMGH